MGLLLGCSAKKTQNNVAVLLRINLKITEDPALSSARKSSNGLINVLFLE